MGMEVEMKFFAVHKFLEGGVSLQYELLMDY